MLQVRFSAEVEQVFLLMIIPEQLEVSRLKGKHNIVVHDFEMLNRPKNLTLAQLVRFVVFEAPDDKIIFGAESDEFLVVRKFGYVNDRLPMEKQSSVYFVKLIDFHENNAAFIQAKGQKSVFLLRGEFVALALVFACPFVLFFHL